MKDATLSALREARAAKRPVAVVTALGSGDETLIEGGTTGAELPAAVRSAARDALRHDRSGTVEVEGERYFVNVFNPPLRLVIVGAVHIAQPLSQMAALAGYEVIVVDPRGSFATAARFPDVTLMDDWPDEGLEKLGLDTRTAVVTLTHDPKLDDPGLHVALRSEAFYIGSLGSRKTHGSRVGRLKEAGFDDAQIDRINAPIGLDLGGRAQAEIAISILAQMTKALHGGGMEKAA